MKLLIFCCFAASWMVGAASHAQEGGAFRLLQINGHVVKWRHAELGVGATVTYALVTELMSFPKARNCQRLGPVSAMLRHSGVAAAAFEREVAAAAAMWQAAADIHFRRVDTPDNADILIGAQAEPRGWAFADVQTEDQTDDTPRTIQRRAIPTPLLSMGPLPNGQGDLGSNRPGDAAVGPAHRITHGLVCLNPEQPWKIGFGGDPQAHDLRYALAHEFGHTIGLDHPGPAGQVMSFIYTENFATLQPGDLKGAAALYGPNPAALMVATTRRTVSVR